MARLGGKTKRLSNRARRGTGRICMVLFVFVLLSSTWPYTVQVQADTKTDALTDIKSIAGTAKELTGYFSQAKTAYEVGKKVAEALGIIKPDDDNTRFAALNEHLDTVYTGLNWQATMFYIAPLHNEAFLAIKHLKAKVNDSNDDRNSENAAYGMFDPYAVPAYHRPYDNNILSSLNRYHLGYTMKDLNPDKAPGNQVYDWRLGIPALFQIISYRMQFIAALDHNFRYNRRYIDELSDYRDTLVMHYDMMLNGIRCGASTDGLTPQWACADIHSGAYSVGKGYSKRDGLATIYYGTSKVWKTGGPDENVYAMLTSQLKSAMPLYEMKAMIDTLYLYTDPMLDLTEKEMLIKVNAEPSLCLSTHESTWFFFFKSTSVLLDTCNGSAQQKWVYHRQTGTIVNQQSGECLEVANGVNGPLTDGSALLVGMAECTGDFWQQWTYDPEMHVVLSALGTVLDIRWGNLQPGTSVWTWPLNGGQAQQWR